MQIAPLAPLSDGYSDQQPCLAAPWLNITPNANVFRNTETYGPPTKEELETRKRLAELDRVKHWRHRKINSITRRYQVYGPISQAGHWLTDKIFAAEEFYENNKARNKD
jgi:hypothetical protein